jgi:hypothetical protein
MASKIIKDSAAVVRRYTSIPAVIDILRRKQLAILDPRNWDDKNDRHFMELYKEHKRVGGLYGLCAAKCPETYHHWKVFTGGGTGGACMVLNRQKLERHLQAVKMPEVTNIRFGDVKYLNLSQVRGLGPKDMNRLPFLKRVGFMDEDEYRIVIETTNDDQSAVFIDCPISWIDCIYLNPWLPKSQAESLIATLKQLPGCKSLDVRRSFLIDSSTWKQAGDEVAGKSPKRFLIVPAKKSPSRTRAGNAKRIRARKRS